MAATSDDDIQSFTIKSRREIVFYLRQLINENEHVSVMFNDGKDMLLTVLLDLDEGKDVLIFDWGANESVNHSLLASERAFFVATPLGVRNQFIASRIWETTYENRPAFATRIPEKFVRLQRREFFRLALPRAQPLRCSFYAGEARTKWDMLVVDIGVGGMALESQTATLPFLERQVIPRVAVSLGEFGKVEVDLEIRHVGTVRRDGKEVGRLGCRFVKLGRAQEMELQRFITQMQREGRSSRYG